MKEYIEREAAYATLTDYYHHTTEGMHSALREALSRVPAADVREVVRGKWIGDNRYFGFPNWHCSRCKGEGRGDYNFCPNCGAKMEADDE